MDVKELSVSKLCCPVCWDLLEILRDGKVDTLQVRGRHAILYDVELPPWLSIDVLEKMVGRYFAYAKTELKNIQPIDKEGNRAHRHVSGSQSDASFTSGYSVNIQRMHEKMTAGMPPHGLDTNRTKIKYVAMLSIKIGLTSPFQSVPLWKGCSTKGIHSLLSMTLISTRPIDEYVLYMSFSIDAWGLQK